MKVIDWLTRTEECINVGLYRNNHNENWICSYDGWNSIDEKYNDIEVEDFRVFSDEVSLFLSEKELAEIE